MEKKNPPKIPFTPIGQVLKSIIDQCRAENKDGILQLIEVWDETIGPPISDNARPFAIMGSHLVVHVSSSAWLHQLQFLKNTLLEKFNHGLPGGPIADIKFKIGRF